MLGRTNVNGARGRAQVEVTTIVGPNASASVVRLDGLEGYGDSKRNHGEPWDHEVGGAIALGRALISLGETMLIDARQKLGDE